MEEHCTFADKSGRVKSSLSFKICWTSVSMLAVAAWGSRRMIYLPAILSGPADLTIRDRPGAACATNCIMASTVSHNSGLHVDGLSSMLSHHHAPQSKEG